MVGTDVNNNTVVTINNLHIIRPLVIGLCLYTNEYI